MSAAVDTLRLTAEEALGLIERGEASSVELHAAYRAAIDERDGELNAFLALVDEVEGDGVPIALKDVISTRGVPTTAGSKILEGYRPVFDSTVAARCKAAGLPLLAANGARVRQQKRIAHFLYERLRRAAPVPRLAVDGANAI